MNMRAEKDGDSDYDFKLETGVASKVLKALNPVDLGNGPEIIFGILMAATTLGKATGATVADLMAMLLATQDIVEPLVKVVNSRERPKRCDS